MNSRKNRLQFIQQYSSILYSHITYDEVRRLEKSPDFCECLDKVDDLALGQGVGDSIADSAKLFLLLARHFHVKHQAISRESSGEFSRCRIYLSIGEVFIGSYCAWFGDKTIYFRELDSVRKGGMTMIEIMSRMTNGFLTAIHSWLFRQQLVQLVVRMRVTVKNSFSMYVEPADAGLVRNLDPDFTARHRFSIEAPISNFGVLYSKVNFI